MSQKQILALKLIGMGSQELRDEIIRQAEENPAIEIISDPFAEGALSVRKKNAPALKESQSNQENKHLFLQGLQLILPVPKR